MYIFTKDTTERVIYELLLKLMTKGQKKLFIEAGLLDRRGRPPKGMTLKETVQKAALKDLKRVTDTVGRCVDLIDPDFNTFHNVGEQITDFLRMLDDPGDQRELQNWFQMRAAAALFQTMEKRNVNEHLREVLFRALYAFFSQESKPKLLELTLTAIMMAPTSRATALKESSVLAKEAANLDVEALSNLWTRLITGSARPASVAEMVTPLTGVKLLSSDDPTVLKARRLLAAFSPRSREKLLDAMKSSSAVRNAINQRVESVEDPNYLIVLSSVLTPSVVPTDLQTDLIPQLYGFIADELNAKGPLRYVTLETQRVFWSVYVKNTPKKGTPNPAGEKMLRPVVEKLGPRAFLTAFAGWLTETFDKPFDAIGQECRSIKWPDDLFYGVPAAALADDGPFEGLYAHWDRGESAPAVKPMPITATPQPQNDVSAAIEAVYKAMEVAAPAQLRDAAARERKAKQLEAADEKRTARALGLALSAAQKAKAEEDAKKAREAAAAEDAAEAAEPAKTAAKPAAPVKEAAATAKEAPAADAPKKAVKATRTDKTEKAVKSAAAAKPAEQAKEPAAATTKTAKPSKPETGRSRLSAAVGAIAGGEPVRDAWPEFLTAGTVHVKRVEVPNPPKLKTVATKDGLLVKEEEEAAAAKAALKEAAKAAKEAAKAAAKKKAAQPVEPVQPAEPVEAEEAVEAQAAEPVAEAETPEAEAAEMKTQVALVKAEAVESADAGEAASEAVANEPAEAAETVADVAPEAPAKKKASKKKPEPSPFQILETPPTDPLVLPIENDVPTPALDVPARGRRLLGVIRIWQNFINFYPVAEWLQGTFKPRSSDDVRHEFPLHGAMNLRNWTRAKPAHGELYVLDFLQGEIERTENADYRFAADVSVMMKDKRVLPAAKFGVYPVVHGEAGDSDVLKTVVATDAAVPARGDVLWATDGFLFGPYAIRENVQKQPYVSLPQKDAVYGTGVLRAWRSGNKTLPVQAAKVFFGVDDDKMPVFAPVHWVSIAGLERVAADRISENLLFAEASAGLVEAEEHPDADARWNLLTTNEAFAASRRARIEAGLGSRTGIVQMAERLRPMFVSVLAEVADVANTGRTGGVVTPERADEIITALVDTPKVAAGLTGHKRITTLLEDTEKRLVETRSELTRARSELKKLEAESDAHRQAAAEAEKTIEDAKRAVENVDILKPLAAIRAGLEADIKTLEVQKSHAMAVFAEEADRIGEHLRAQVRAVKDVAFEGAVAAKFAEAAAEWNAREEAEAFAAKADDMAKREMSPLTGAKLVDHLIDTLTVRRPYAAEDVLNLYLTVTQHFLTIFAGAPGSGKTSACTLIADALGLVKAERFLPVSVERGWTSKRDFIGYWNPLTKRFESADSARYEAVRMMDVEARRGMATAPYFMLLDEANLSPMEYYWADFMNVSDERGNLAFLSLGGDTRCRIPDHLRFLATINNDFTTEALSPRLLDRAAIVTLPETEIVSPTDLADAPLIPWRAMTATFGAKPADERVKTLVAELEAAFAGLGIAPSIRTRKDLLGYVAAGIPLFGNTATPLDYAAMQRLIPKVNAAGDDAGDALKRLLDFTQARGMVRTEAAVLDILRRGEEAMGCYRWF